jgi:hypothetical protein
LHPTVKPTAMVADAVLDVTRRGDIVLDPFLGSGATLMACERSGRRCTASNSTRSTAMSSFVDGNPIRVTPGDTGDMRFWAAHAVFAAVLVGTLASRERSAEPPIDDAGLESVVLSVARSQGLGFREYRNSDSLWRRVLWRLASPAVRS